MYGNNVNLMSLSAILPVKYLEFWIKTKVGIMIYDEAKSSAVLSSVSHQGALIGES
jgi:hypothetical protein